MIFILVAGILIRIILSAITFHSDIVHFDLAGFVLSGGNILNFYDYPGKVFNYPPAVYFTLGPIFLLLTIFTNPQFHNQFLFHTEQTFRNVELFWHLFILKTPYLIFDLAVAFLLYNLFNSKREKILAFSLWIFNPVNLYSTYMMGQFDIIPTFFTVAALFTVLKTFQKDFFKKILIASLFLGIGASFKIYPVMFLVPLAFLLKDWIKRFLAVLIGILTYLLTIIPFLHSQGFRETALVANQTLKSLYAQIPISGGESIILFLAAIGFFYLIFLYNTSKVENLWQRFFIIILLFFVFTHYHPQWFVWLTPFLIIELVSTNFKHLFVVILMFISFLGGILLFEPGLNIGLFAPINPVFYTLDIWKTLGINIDYNFSKSLFQTLFVSCAFYFIYKYFPKKEG